MSATRSRASVQVQGVVQGVGFRPYVHRLAAELGLDGFVLNDERVRMDSLFVQDAWRVHDRVRLVLGLRWDDHSTF